MEAADKAPQDNAVRRYMGVSLGHYPRPPARIRDRFRSPGDPDPLAVLVVGVIIALVVIPAISVVAQIVWRWASE